MRWTGEIALVTGASSGIGRSIAQKLAQMGMRVALTARREGRLAELASEIRSRGGHAEIYPTDLRRPEMIPELFDKIKQRQGAVRLLVNNAGLGHNASLLDGGTEEWREMLEVNVLALCACTREATRHMRQDGDWGQVIHVSSMSAHRVPHGSGVYSASKFAVRSLTEGLRLELHEAGSRIRVCAVSPGFVRTEFAAQYHKSEAAADATYSRYEVLEPDDVANAVQYILEQPQRVQLHDLLMRPTEQGN